MRVWRNIAIFCLLSVQAFSSAAATRILILGDSLSTSYRIRAEESWVALARGKLRHQGIDAVVINVSLKGQTATDGARRIGGLLERYRPDVVILALGANDGLRRRPLEGLYLSLEAILNAIRVQGGRSLLVGMKLPPETPSQYAQGFQAVYTRLAAKAEAPLVPFLLEKIAGKPEYFLADRLHPNAAAQPLLLETLWPPLWTLLRPFPAP